MIIKYQEDQATLLLIAVIYRNFLKTNQNTIDRPSVKLYNDSK